LRTQRPKVQVLPEIPIVTRPDFNLYLVSYIGMGFILVHFEWPTWVTCLAALSGPLLMWISIKAEDHWRNKSSP
jgi:hypothetical protein